MIFDMTPIPTFSIPGNSKVFIFQSSRSFSPEEQSELLSQIQHFLKNWTSHGSQMQTECKIAFHRFIIIAINDKPVYLSGCATDALNRFIMQLQLDFQVSLFDRMTICFWQNDLKKIESIHLSNITPAISQHLIKPQTLVFDNSCQTIDDLKSKWIQPLQQTWMKKFLIENNSSAHS